MRAAIVTSLVLHTELHQENQSNLWQSLAIVAHVQDYGL